MREEIARLSGIIQRTENVKSFRFVLPEKIDFLPGQFLEVVFDPAHRENKDLNKYLSLSSSPTKDYIEVTKRISDSAFSRKLQGLKINDEVKLKLPMGTCVFKDEYKRISFLIGGIGITPVIAILEYIIEKKLDTEVSLLYSNRTEEEIAFRKELDTWQGLGKKIKVYYTVTDCQPKDKTCFFGYINKDLLKNNACDLEKTKIFIFGPPKMVEAMYNLSLELNCSKENINTERFVGY